MKDWGDSSAVKRYAAHNKNAKIYTKAYFLSLVKAVMQAKDLDHFLVPMLGGSQMSVTPTARGLPPCSGILRHVHMQTHTNVCTNIEIIFKEQTNTTCLAYH